MFTWVIKHFFAFYGILFGLFFSQSQFWFQPTQKMKGLSFKLGIQSITLFHQSSILQKDYPNAARQLTDFLFF